jgi:predicted glycosyltransferase
VRIVCYAQHLSGVGHFVRMHALARGLGTEHEVHLAAGGRPVPTWPDPGDPHPIALPPVARCNGRLTALDGHAPIEQVLETRLRTLERAVERIRPGALLVDHYPFSKWELEGEIQAAIEAARRADPAVRILCSLRDVVRQTRYEPLERAAYETRVLTALRSSFDGVLVHADPRFTRIEEHFAGAASLPVPVAYTGFVTQPEAAAAVDRPTPPYAVLSCGGGSGALAFLLAATAAFRRLADDGSLGAMRLVVFAGGFATASDLAALDVAAAGGPVHVRRFAAEFPTLLRGSALSISRAGYNTCVALLRSRTPAVLAPDPVMSDQEYRAQRFARLGLASVVEGDPPAEEALAAAIRSALASPPARHDFDLDGVARTGARIAEWITAARPSST